MLLAFTWILSDDERHSINLEETYNVARAHKLGDGDKDPGTKFK